ncbi:MAG TPA: hypothetical protein VGQ91_10490, partial [Ideonella sp.]|nr:hypothetical protein [Ideonella sp.]
MPKHLLSRLAAALISAAGTLAMAQTPSPTAPAPASAAADPYLWLEDVTGEKALAWVRERNTASRAVL